MKNLFAVIFVYLFCNYALADSTGYCAGGHCALSAQAACDAAAASKGKGYYALLRPKPGPNGTTYLSCDYYSSNHVYSWFDSIEFYGCPDGMSESNNACVSSQCEKGLSKIFRSKEYPLMWDPLNKTYLLLGGPDQLVCYNSCYYQTPHATRPVADKCYRVKGSIEKGFCNALYSSTGEQCTGDNPLDYEVGDPLKPEAPPPCTGDDCNKPDPEKPDPEKPDPEKPDPEKPDPEKPDPEKPDPENPNGGGSGGSGGGGSGGGNGNGSGGGNGNGSGGDDGNGSGGDDGNGSGGGNGNGSGGGNGNGSGGGDGNGSGGGDGNGSGNGDGDGNGSGGNCDPSKEECGEGGEGSASGINCKETLICKGDAVQCAQLQKQKEIQCAQEELYRKDAEIEQLLTKEVDKNTQKIEGLGDEKPEETNVGSLIKEGTRWLPSSCPAPVRRTISVGGYSYELNIEMSPLCGMASDLSGVIVAIFSFLAIRCFAKD